LQLVKIIEKSVPAKVLHKGGSVAKKTFQAIRIEVNGELEDLDRVLNQMVNSLNIGGRLVVLTFHSLEDRIVKNVFKDCATGCICPKELPICVCHHKESIKLVNRKPIIASNEELKNNSRSTSAKLRIAEKV
jgi:16S rRNA (cytosine1402-N4)-methyltransferase